MTTVGRYGMKIPRPPHMQNFACKPHAFVFFFTRPSLNHPLDRQHQRCCGAKLRLRPPAVGQDRLTAVAECSFRLALALHSAFSGMQGKTGEEKFGPQRSLAIHIRDTTRNYRWRRRSAACVVYLIFSRLVTAQPAETLSSPTHGTRLNACRLNGTLMQSLPRDHETTDKNVSPRTPCASALLPAFRQAGDAVSSPMKCQALG